MAKDPIRLLNSLFPWPEEKPNVSERHERWFNRHKQVLLRQVVPRNAKLVVELGSWLGDSTRWFCEWCPDATVVAVDTWLGSAEHLLKRRSMLPVLHETFLANCWEFRDRLIPFWNTSLVALNFLARLKLQPEVIYFDSDHSFWGLLSELETANELFPKAMLVGDDGTNPTVKNTLKVFTKYRQPCRGRCKDFRGWNYNELHNTWAVE